MTAAPRRFCKPLSNAQLAARGRALISALELFYSRRRMSRHQLEALQSRLLLELVVYAYDHVPLYREKYLAAGFDPRQLRGREDLTQIPVLTKDELRRAPRSQLKCRDYPAPARLLSSSGSTGIPSQLYRDEDSLAYFAAQGMAEYHAWCAGKPLEEVLYFVDLSPRSIDQALADWLRATVPEERICDACVPAEMLLANLERFKPEFISSYPSTLRGLAMTLDRRGKSYERLRLLHLTSEMLDYRTRQLLGRVFPRARHVETYTSTEAGLIAASCSAGRWHLSEESALFEIVDDAMHPTNSVGQLLVTSLTNWATPLIRYAGLGDFCRWENSSCSCGQHLRSICQLAGRATDTLTMPDGSLVAPFTLTNALEEVPGMYQFQIIERGPGDLEVMAVADSHAPFTCETLTKRLRQALVEVLPNTARVAVRLVDEIAVKAGTHKTPLVVSRLGNSNDRQDLSPTARSA